MSVVDTAKTIGELVKAGVTLELQEKIIQLRKEALDLEEENLRLKKENLKLKQEIELQATVTYRVKLYWCEGDEVPFCPYCYEKSKLLIHLDGPEYSSQGEEFYTCGECNQMYRAGPDTDHKFRIHHPELNDTTD